METNDNPLLEKYIARLLELQQASVEQLTQAEMQEIAKEIGLTEQDLKDAEKIAADSLKRADTYQQVGKWNEAQRELQLAIDIQPFNPEVQYQFANFYFEKWKKLKQKADMQAMELHIQNILAKVPNHASAIQLMTNFQTEQQKNKRVKRWKRGFASVGISVLALGLLAFLKIIGVFDPNPTGFEGRTYQIPVEFVPNKEAEGVMIEIDYCQIQHSEYVGTNSIGYQCLVRISSQKFEIETLRLKAEFLDSQNKVVATDDFVWVVNANSEMDMHKDRFRIQPNDVLPLSFNEGIGMIYFKENHPSEIKKMRFLVDIINRYMPPASYPTYPAIPFSWVSVAPDYLSFDVRERLNYVAEESENTNTVHILNVEITHTGSSPCRELVLELDWIDENNKVVSSKEIPLISLKHRPLLPKERLIFSEINYCRPPEFPFPKAFTKYHLKVKSAN
jgi:hypothetical protein